jgi:AraC-like DNA-binding protein
VTNADSFGKFRESHAYVGRLAIKLLSWDCQATCETSVVRTADHHVSLHIPLDGEFEAQQAGEWIRVRPGEMLVVSSPGVTRRRWVGACDLLNVMIGRGAVASAFGAASDRGVLSGLPLTLIDLRRETTLALFIETLVQDLGREENSAFSEPETLPHVERLLLTLLAKSLKCDERLSARRDLSMIAPYYVRRAEDYILANYAHKIRMDDVAEAAGVSVRTLHYGFARYRDHSPIERLRAVRLAHARRDLMEAPTKGQNVAAVAARVGYANQSQFSRDYKGYFGESPSDTLRSARV